MCVCVCVCLVAVDFVFFFRALFLFFWDSHVWRVAFPSLCVSPLLSLSLLVFPFVSLSLVLLCVCLCIYGSTVSCVYVCVCSVNAVRRGPHLLLTGADDCTARVWDLRQRQAAQTLQHTYQVLSASFGDSSDVCFTGGLDNVIQVHGSKREADTGGEWRGFERNRGVHTASTTRERRASF
jgi:WD40 repeat protein